MSNYFTELNSVDVGGKTEKKNGLTYLSWAWAWGEVKKRHPDATYKIYENADGWNYHTDGRTCWVKTGVTVEGIEHIEYLPVMDFRNASIPAEKVTSFDVNKAIQRSLTKAVARHGLGLYIYAGEDLPEEAKAEAPREEKPKAEPAKGKQNFYAQSVAAKAEEITKKSCHLCGKALTDPEVSWCESHADRFKGHLYCRDCQKIAEKGQAG